MELATQPTSRGSAGAAVHFLLGYKSYSPEDSSKAKDEDAAEGGCGPLFLVAASLLVANYFIKATNLIRRPTLTVISTGISLLNTGKLTFRPLI